MTKPMVTARVWHDGEARVIEVRGQTAKALVALVTAGEHGRTAKQVAGWAFRFAAYCHELRHRYDIDIRTDREEHPGGWHGRHVLVSPVEIVSVTEMEPWPNAA
jgi:hypothetical protein